MLRLNKPYYDDGCQGPGSLQHAHSTATRNTQEDDRCLLSCIDQTRHTGHSSLAHGLTPHTTLPMQASNNDQQLHQAPQRRGVTHSSLQLSSGCIVTINTSHILEAVSLATAPPRAAAAVPLRHYGSSLPPSAGCVTTTITSPQLPYTISLAAAPPTKCHHLSAAASRAAAWSHLPTASVYARPPGSAVALFCKSWAF